MKDFRIKVSKSKKLKLLYIQHTKNYETFIKTLNTEKRAYITKVKDKDLKSCFFLLLK